MDIKNEMLELGEKMVSSSEVYDGKLLHVYKDMVEAINRTDLTEDLSIYL